MQFGHYVLCARIERSPYDKTCPQAQSGFRMRAPEFAHFPTSEYADRVSRARKAMDNRYLDGLLVTAKENVIYFSGLRTISWISKHRAIAVLVPRDADQPVVSIIPENLYDVQDASSWVEEVRPWGGWRRKDAIPDPVVVIANACKEAGLGAGRIGLEIGVGQRMAMTRSEVDQLQTLLPGASFEDGASALWDARTIKSPAEQDALRFACAATDKAFSRAFQELRPGITEKELAGIIMSELVLETHEKPGFVMIRSGQAKYGMVNVEPFERVIEPGDIVVIDIGANYKDYWSDFMRMACIGEPSSDQMRFFDAELASQLAGVDALRPGVPLGAVFDACFDTLIDHGLAEHVPGMERVGHGIGLDVHEPPSIARGAKEVAEPGMVVAVEPIFWDLPDHKIGNFAIEDNILVTEDGIEILSKTPKELRIIN